MVANLDTRHISRRQKGYKTQQVRKRKHSAETPPNKQETRGGDSKGTFKTKGNDKNKVYPRGPETQISKLREEKTSKNENLLDVSHLNHDRSTQSEEVTIQQKVR